MKISITVISMLVAFATLQGCREHRITTEAKPLDSAYSREPDWNNPKQFVPLNYQQAQGQRIFYTNCVWCHADSTPAGPSNRSNLNPLPVLANDGTTLNSQSDEYLTHITTLGGNAMSKSALMPPWGRTLRQEDIRGVIAFLRVIAQPPYHPSPRPASQYSEK